MNQEIREHLFQEQAKEKKLSHWMEEGERSQNGMQTLNQSLLQHLLARRISLKEAFQVSTDPENLNRLLGSKGI